MKVSTRLYRIVRSATILVLLSLFWFSDVTPVSADAITVETTVDVVDNTDNLCSLREAVYASINQADYNECRWTPNAYIWLQEDTYTVDQGSLPPITTDVKIYGANPNTTILQPSSCNPTEEVSCANKYRLFNVTSGTLTLNKLTIRYGYTEDLDGGAIKNHHGTLNIYNSIFLANKSKLGGAIRNYSKLYIKNSTFSLNTANNFAVIPYNHSAGAIFNSDLATATIEESTFSSNSANWGGAIRNSGTMDIINCTFSGNSALDEGGAIFNLDTSIITNSTFSENAAVNGGAGIYNTNNGTLEIKNTIIANATAGSECINAGGAIATNLKNLIEDGTCSPDYSGDPSLGPLADNDGHTQTHALLPGSPAMEMADPDACPATDQRGVDRPQGDECDIGAYEFEYITNFIPLFSK